MNHKEPDYPNPLAVAQALEDLADELTDLAGQIATTRRMLHIAIRQDKVHLVNLHAIHSQLCRCARNVEYMQTGLGHNMLHLLQ